MTLFVRDLFNLLFGDLRKSFKNTFPPKKHWEEHQPGKKSIKKGNLLRPIAGKFIREMKTLNCIRGRIYALSI